MLRLVVLRGRLAACFWDYRFNFLTNQIIMNFLQLLDIYLEFRLISSNFRKDLIKITYTILSFWKLLDSGWSFIPRPPSTHLKNQNMAWWFTQQSKEEGQKLLWEPGPCLGRSPEKKMLYFGYCLNFLFPQPPPLNLGNLYNFFLASEFKIWKSV